MNGFLSKQFYLNDGQSFSTDIRKGWLVAWYITCILTNYSYAMCMQIKTAKMTRVIELSLV